MDVWRSTHHAKRLACARLLLQWRGAPVCTPTAAPTTAPTVSTTATAAATTIIAEDLASGSSDLQQRADGLPEKRRRGRGRHQRSRHRSDQRGEELEEHDDEGRERRLKEEGLDGRDEQEEQEQEILVPEKVDLAATDVARNTALHNAAHAGMKEFVEVGCCCGGGDAGKWGGVAVVGGV